MQRSLRDFSDSSACLNPIFMKKLLFFLSFWLLAATTWAADEMLSNPGFEAEQYLKTGTCRELFLQPKQPIR